MNTLEAVNIFKKKFPKKQCVQLWDYDDQHYVIEAVDNMNNIDPFSQTTFGIDKKSGAITGFPMSIDNAAELQRKKAISLA